MKYFHFLTLVIGFVVLIEVKCEDPMNVRICDPEKFVKGRTYERFAFLTDLTIDDNNGDTKLDQNSSAHFEQLGLSELGSLDSICLDEVMADVYNSYILTGVRFYRLGNTLTFQIQQGQFWRGRIDKSTVHWVEPAEKCNNIVKMTASKRTLMLDDNILPGMMVTTGVAFRSFDYVPKHEQENLTSLEISEKSPFYFAVIGHGLSSFHYLNFNLNTRVPSWVSSDMKRTNLINDDMDKPTALVAPLYNKVLSKSGKNYVTFALTKPKQGSPRYTIPYVDTQQVDDPDNSQFVRGIGLYYKGYDGYGGYIAPSIFVPERVDCSFWNEFLEQVRN